MSLHVSGAGGPGSRKGALVEQLVSEFGAMLITADSLVQQMQTHESTDEHIQSLPWSVRYCHVYCSIPERVVDLFLGNDSRSACCDSLQTHWALWTGIHLCCLTCCPTPSLPTMPVGLLRLLWQASGAQRRACAQLLRLWCDGCQDDQTLDLIHTTCRAIDCSVCSPSSPTSTAPLLLGRHRPCEVAFG